MNRRMIAIAAGLLAASVGAFVALGGFGERAPETAAPFRPKGEMFLTDNGAGTRVYLDADTVRGDRTSRQGWVISDHTDDKSAEDRKSKDLFRVNCETTSFQIVSALAEKRDGTTGKAWNEAPGDPATMQYAVPDTIGADVVTAICDERYDPPEDRSDPAK